MKAIRDSRWVKAFQYGDQEDDMSSAKENEETRLSHFDGINLKATIVIEHLIQASDVAVSFLETHLAYVLLSVFLLWLFCCNSHGCPFVFVLNQHNTAYHATLGYLHEVE
jgi:hypothetical protein